MFVESGAFFIFAPIGARCFALARSRTVPFLFRYSGANFSSLDGFYISKDGFVVNAQV